MSLILGVGIVPVAALPAAAADQTAEFANQMTVNAMRAGKAPQPFKGEKFAGNRGVPGVKSPKQVPGGKAASAPGATKQYCAKVPANIAPGALGLGLKPGGQLCGTIRLQTTEKPGSAPLLRLADGSRPKYLPAQHGTNPPNPSSKPSPTPSPSPSSTPSSQASPSTPSPSTSPTPSPSPSATSTGSVGPAVYVDKQGSGSRAQNALTSTGPSTFLSPNWVDQSPPTQPQGMTDGSMAYDAARNQIVLFGGYGTAAPMGQTWTWSNGVWTQKTPATSPPARDLAAMAWDPQLNEVVLFGGRTYAQLVSSSDLGDLWAWTGSNWVALPNASGPSIRDGAAMAWNPSINALVVFGGNTVSNGAYNDTWKYSSGVWTRLQANGASGAPAYRGGSEIAYSTSTSQLVLFGGAEQNCSSCATPTVTYGSDTWLFNGTGWTQQSPSNTPPGRGTMSMAYDPGIGAIVLVGGIGGTPASPAFLTDTWAWNGSTWLQAVGITSAGADFKAPMAATASGQLVLGEGIGTSEATYVYDANVPVLGIALSTSGGKGGPTGPNGIYYTGDTAVVQVTAANPGVNAINNYTLTSPLTSSLLAPGSQLTLAPTVAQLTNPSSILNGCPQSGACGGVSGLVPTFNNLSLNSGATSVAQFLAQVVGNTRGCSIINVPAIVSNLTGTTPTVSTPLTVCGGGLGVEKWWTYDTTQLGVGGVAKVNAANGNLVVKQTDSTPVQSHGQLAFELGRAYNSQDNMNTPGPLGAGWQWDLSATGDAASPGLDVGGLIVPTLQSILQPLSVTYVDRDGTRDVFRQRSTTVASTALKYLDTTTVRLGQLPALTLTGSNALLCVDASYSAPPGVDMYLWRYAQLNVTGNCAGASAGSGSTLGWAVVRPNRERYDYDVQGRLVDVVDASGNELVYNYSGANLSSITSNRCTGGGACPQITIGAPMAITVAGNSYNRIDVTDPAGRVTTYIVAQPSSSTPLSELSQVWNPDNPFTTASGASAFVGTPSISYTYATTNTSCAGSTTGTITIGALCSVTDAAGGTTTFGYTKAPLGPDRILSVTDRRANAAGGQSATTGSETVYNYTNASDGWSTTQVTADTAAPATVGAPSGASAPTGCNNSGSCERNNYTGIDAAGRVGEVDQGTAANYWLHQEAFFWDGNPNGGINSCEQPDAAVDNNLCETITRAVPSSTAFAVNGVGTSTINGVTVADQGVSYVYNELGVPLSVTKVLNPAAGWSASAKDITTYGNHLQYVESDATNPVHVFNDRVLGNGKVESSSDANPSSYYSTVIGDHPIAYYRFDNLTGNTATDSSGTGNDGTEYPGVVLNQPGAVPGNGSVGEPGTNAPWVAVVNNLNHFANGTGTSSAFSVEAWMKTTSSATDYTVCTPCNGTGLAVGRYGGKPWVWLQGGSGQTLNVVATTPVNDGAWHDVVFTYDGSGSATTGVKIYVDGVLSANPTIYNNTLGTNSWRTDGSVVGYGYNSGSTTPDGSLLDELSLYNTVLTPGQVTAHYGAVANVSRGDATTLYAISDSTQMLTPRGNAAGGNWGDYLTSYRHDVPQSYAAGTAGGATYPSPNTTSGAVCTPGGTPQNTGLLCETDAPASAGVSAGVCLLPSTAGGGVPAGGPTDAGDSYTCTRSTYDAMGQRTANYSPKANSTSPAGAATTYTYYSDTSSCSGNAQNNCDLSGKVSAGGWLKAATDPAGNSVIYAYDRAGNIARTWDRNATSGHAIGDPWTTVDGEPSTNFTESDTSVPVTSASLSVSAYDTEIVTPQGLVVGSGDNAAGQLGTGNTNNSSTPMGAVGGLHDVIQVAQASTGGLSSAKGTYALTGSGQVYFWGNNTSTPTLVTGLPPIASISAGGLHVLALDRSGQLWGWGYSGNGQVGNGSTASYVAPVMVMSGVATFAAGGYHSLAVKTDGTLWAWGYNNYGELGNNSTSAATTPTQVSGLTNVTAVSAGSFSSYAIKSDGTVWAWGDNTYGALGTGSSAANALTPQQITNLGAGPGTSNSPGAVAQIVGSVYGAAALMSDGTVQAWGLNNYGQLGGNSTNTTNPSPVKIQGLAHQVALNGGWATYLSANEAGVVTIWGSTGSGQVGDGSSAAQVLPEPSAYNINPFSAPWRYPTEARDQVGNRLTSAVDADGMPTIVRSARGNAVLSTTYDTYSSYDAENNLTSVLTPAERAAGPSGAAAPATYTYDPFGNRSTAMDPRGNTSLAFYDSVNRPIIGEFTRGTAAQSTGSGCSGSASGSLWSAQQLGHTVCITTSTYDGSNQLIQHYDANSQYTLTTYDGAGEKVQQLTPRTPGAAPSLKTAWVYNPDGQVTDVCPPREFDNSEPDSAGACTSSAPYSVHSSIDAAGRVSAITQYRVTSSTSATAETTSTGFDADGNPISTTDANGHTTTISYDLLDRKQTMSVPRAQGVSNNTTWTYDPSGDVTTQTSPAGLNFGDGVNGALVVDGTTAANSTDGVAHSQSNPFQVPDGSRYTTVTLQNGGWITSKAANGLVFYATGTVSVCSGCGITMAGQGQTGGAGGNNLLGTVAGANGNISAGNGGYGGAGSLLAAAGGGGGGGHNGAGSAGATPSGGGAGGAGGATSGTADFSDVGTNYIAAAGGGGGGAGQGLLTAAAPSGGNGGGFIHISAPTINVKGTVSVAGTAGGSATGNNAGGGGGAGGGMWLTATNINLASPSVLNTAGGAGGTSTGNGGAGGAGASGYVRLEADNVTNPPAGANRTRAGQTTAYSYDADHRVLDTVAGFQGATAADIATVLPDSLGQVNERTRVGYDPDGNKVIAFNPRAFTDNASLTSPKLAFSARSDYDADGRLIATYDPRYNTADPATADVASGGDGGTSTDQQTMQCPTGADPSLAPGYATYPNTIGVCVTRASYDADGNPARSYLPTSTGSDNRYSAASYTDDNLLYTVTSPDPSAADGGTARVTSATYLYDGDGRRISATDANGNTSTTKYTADGLISEADGQSYTVGSSTITHVVKYGYDANGNQTTLTAPDAAAPASGYVAADYTTTTAWTSDGLKSKITAPGNATGSNGFNVTSYTYDAMGNPLTVKSPSASAGDATNPSGLSSVNTYTFDNLIASTANPISTGNYRVTLYGYTPSGQKASTDVGTCASSNLTNCVPSNGAWTDGGTLRYTYAPDGVNVTQIGRNNATITTTYDQAGNPTKIASTDSSVTVTGSYYLDGLPRTASDGTNSNTYAFDASGMPSLRTDQTGSGGFTAGAKLSTSFAYNDAGLPKVGTSSVTSANTTWAYDSAGRPTTRTDAGGSNNRTVSQVFNPDNSVKSLTTSVGGTTIASDTYGYDNNGSITSDAVAGSAQGFTNTYAYNPAGNVTSAAQSGGTGTTSTYGWDHNSNRISVTTGGTTATATYNADNTLATSNSGGTGASTVTSTYSPAGELTQTAVGATVCSSVTYDNFQRTASQTQNANTTCGTTQKSSTTYTYDGLDRIQSITTTPTGGSSPAAYTTHSSYDGLSSQLVGQTGAATGATNNPGGTVTTAYQLNPTGAPVAYSQTPVGGGTPTASWLNKNAQGSITSITGVGSTSVTCSVNYDPFGSPQQASAPPSGNGVCTQANSTANTVWYRGAPRDASYGTYQFGSRTYNPTTASFTTPDTYRASTPAQDLSVGVDPLTANTYTYVNGNPINLTDPTGHCSANPFSDDDCYSQAVSTAVNTAVDVGTTVVNTTIDVGTTVVDTTINGAKDLYNGAKSAFGFGLNVLNDLNQGFVAAFNQIGKVLNAAYNKAKSAVKTVYHAATKVVTSTVNFVKKHAVTIGAFAASIAVGLGCEAATGIETAGTSTIACAAAAGSVYGAINGAATCHGNVGCIATSTAIGGLGGAAGGVLSLGASALTSKLVSSLGSKAIGDAADSAATSAADNIASSTGNRVFWSGGDIAKNAAMDYAIANGSKTLEMTLPGRLLEKLPYNSVTAKLWDLASAGFAATARGDANVFIGPAFRGGDSVFGRIEGPILNFKGNTIIQRFIGEEP